MKIEILKDGLRDMHSGKAFKVGQKITVDEERAKRAIDRGNAKEVKSTKKKSQQSKVEDSLEKK